MSKQPSQFLSPQQLRQPLAALGSQPELTHMFEIEHINAINTAIACRRPLLLTGESGVGKSQLARAAAAALKRPYIRHTVDAHTEVHDLLWRFDAVGRLADAQLVGDQQDTSKVAKAENYLRPGPLWWGFDWAAASARNGNASPVQPDLKDTEEAMARLAKTHGVTVLIDEIDKASSEIPNALLEALGEGGFWPDHAREPVRAKHEPPLVILTSNREKTLPNAFLRRCLVMRMKLHDDDDAVFAEFLAERGEVHTSLGKEDRLRVARDLIEDRNKAKRDNKRPMPGQAEYLDMLYAIAARASEANAPDISQLIAEARPYLFGKADQV